jgi:hypothetical protein
MTAVEDQEPVQALAPHAADPALGEGARPGRPNRCSDDLYALIAEDPIEAETELAVAVVIKKQIGRPRSASDQARSRACWATQAPLGLALTPAMWTRRLCSSMKNRT